MFYCLEWIDGANSLPHDLIYMYTDQKNFCSLLRGSYTPKMTSRSYNNPTQRESYSLSNRGWRHPIVDIYHIINSLLFTLLYWHFHKNLFLSLQGLAWKRLSFYITTKLLHFQLMPLAWNLYWFPLYWHGI